MQMVDIMTEVLRSSSDEEVDDSDKDKDYVAGDEEDDSDGGEPRRKMPTTSKRATGKGAIKKKGNNVAAVDTEAAGCSNDSGTRKQEAGSRSSSLQMFPKKKSAFTWIRLKRGKQEILILT